jgi:hypothetical protein
VALAGVNATGNHCPVGAGPDSCDVQKSCPQCTFICICTPLTKAEPDFCAKKGCGTHVVPNGCSGTFTVECCGGSGSGDNNGKPGKPGNPSKPGTPDYFAPDSPDQPSDGACLLYTVQCCDAMLARLLACIVLGMQLETAAITDTSFAVGCSLCCSLCIHVLQHFSRTRKVLSANHSSNISPNCCSCGF